MARRRRGRFPVHLLRGPALEPAADHNHHDATPLRTRGRDRRDNLQRRIHKDSHGGVPEPDMSTQRLAAEPAGIAIFQRHDGPPIGNRGPIAEIHLQDLRVTGPDKPGPLALHSMLAQSFPAVFTDTSIQISSGNRGHKRLHECGSRLAMRAVTESSVQLVSQLKQRPFEISIEYFSAVAGTGHRAFSRKMAIGDQESPRFDRQQGNYRTTNSRGSDVTIAAPVQFMV